MLGSTLSFSRSKASAQLVLWINFREQIVCIDNIKDMGLI